MSEYLNIGQIVNVHGLKGEVKVFPLTDDVERFRKLKQIFLEQKNMLQEFRVEHIKIVKNMAVLKLEGIDTVDAANRLRGVYVQIDRKDAVKLPKDTYFICDLLGVEIYETNGNYLGKIVDVLQTGSNDVYVVRDGNAKILIPALKSIFRVVDMEARRMEAELPEGLKANAN